MDNASIETWSQVKDLIQNWFVSPVKVLLPSVAILLSIILAGPKQWKLLISNALVLIISIYIILLSPIGASLAVNSLTLFVPQSKIQSADAIVILGRGKGAIKQRTQAAATLFKAGCAPFIIVTATGSLAQNHAESLVRLGISKDAILLEDLARTTEENASYTASILKTVSANRVILITDKPHILRSTLTFQSFNFEIIPFPVDLPETLSPAEASVLSIREYVALLSYWALGRFSPRSIDTSPILAKPFELFKSGH